MFSLGGALHKVKPILRYRSFAITVLILFLAVGAHGSSVIDRTPGNSAAYSQGLAGIGQTFIAQEPFLQDASLILTASPDSRVWWNDAHLQLVSNFPIGRGGPTAPNVIYTSPRVDFSTLSQVGQLFEYPTYELKLSSAGLSGVLPITIGAKYSLLLSNFGQSGDSFWAFNQPRGYAQG